MSTTISMRDMLEAGVHFGHRTRYWNPKMKRYIWSSHQKLHIINLEHSLPMFRDALSVIQQIVQNRGKVLFVGTKASASGVVREEAVRAGMPYVDHRWLGGMLTNFSTIRKSLKKLSKTSLITLWPKRPGRYVVIAFILYSSLLSKLHFAA